MMIQKNILFFCLLVKYIQFMVLNMNYCYLIKIEKERE